MELDWSLNDRKRKLYFCEISQNTEVLRDLAKVKKTVHHLVAWPFENEQIEEEDLVPAVKYVSSFSTCPLVLSSRFRSLT